MYSKITSFIQKHSVLLIAGIVAISAPLISQNCHVFWYQEKEPEGLNEYFNTKK